MSEQRHPIIGLVGCGGWGCHVLRDLRTLGCEVHVVARSPASRANAEAGGATRIVTETADLALADGVVVVVPVTAHATVLDDALALGCPVFVEKPLTCDPESARRLAAAAPDRLFVMDKWRYHPGVLELAAITRSGELGAVRGLRTSRLQWGTNHPDTDPIWVLAPHDLSIALEILGSVLSPRAAVLEGAATDPLGLLGLLGDDIVHVMEVSAGRTEYRRRVELSCDDGVAVLADGYDTSVLVARHGADASRHERREVSGELPLLRELRTFVEHLDGGPGPVSSAADGAAIVEAISELRALAGLERGGRR
jgi:predicted dehydrogenase